MMIVNDDSNDDSYMD